MVNAWAGIRGLAWVGSPALTVWMLMLPPMNSVRQTEPGQAPLLLESMVGADLYQAYCSPCHGLDAKGSGPVAAALREAPPDLTTLAQRNGGTYPFDRVLTSVGGEPQESVVSHGTTEMPVWGPIFRQLGASEAEARERVRNLVRYLESIQEK